MTRGHYLPIADYALIGDTRAAALVAPDGGIDWCCLPAFDSPSLFARILDEQRGGHFTVTIPGATTSRRYLGESNVLETTFRTADGVATLTDALPIPEAGSGRFEGPWLLRLLYCTEGVVEYSAQCDARPFYAGERPPRPDPGAPDGFLLTFGLSASTNATGDHDWSTGGTLRSGESVAFSFSLPHGSEVSDGPEPDEAASILEATRQWWARWAARATYHGPDRDAVVRSALVLKALTSSPHGSMVAAPTCSLPERIGGSLNWDYRYAWLRDSTLGFLALADLGYDEELAAYWRWIERTTSLDADQLGVMYRIDGGRDMDESTLSFEGYRGSQPVRVGNEASIQSQLDTYGWTVATADRFSAAGGALSPEAWRFITDVAERTIERWVEPDAGIWEVRERLAHLVYSKAMCWFALDRAIAIAERDGFQADLDRWRATRDTIRAEVLQHGIDPRLGRFVAAYGSTDLDASLLQLPRIGFIEASHPAMRATIEALRDELSSSDGLLYRNEFHGPKGYEGLFTLCSYWLADCLVDLGEHAAARAIVDRLHSYASDLGLLSEELDPATGELLGNFPQAFSHTGHIQTAVRLAAATAKG